jgi:hypothetical protein
MAPRVSSLFATFSPGLYDLATFISNMDAATSVDVRSSDVENVNLSLTPASCCPQE